MSKAKRADLSTFGWPPLQPIATASAYVPRPRWMLYRAVAGGEQPIAGRRGRALTRERAVGPEVETFRVVGQLSSVSKTKRPDLSTFGWPPLQPIATASAYVSRSRWTLYRAVARGELPIAGRRGRALVFRREDLDRWMLGGIAATPAVADPPAPLGPSSALAVDEDAR